MKNETKEKETERRGTSALTRLLAPREIKFRAKLYESDKWVYGGGVQQVGENIGMISLDDNRQLIIYQIDPETVCEFAGLEDKNGKEIYEGDIVRRLSIQSEYQTHYFKNSASHDEQIDTNFHWSKTVVRFENGYFNIANLLQMEDWWEEMKENEPSQEEQILDVFGLPKYSDGTEALKYLEHEGYKFNSIKDVAIANNQYELIGNIFENPELLE